MAKALAARVGERPVAFIGGVLQLHPVIGAEIRAQLPGIEVSQPPIDSALTAARLQMDGVGGQWRATLAALG
ncbi:hypothetical protein D3C87_1765020 [compost metagenome]